MIIPYGAVRRVLVFGIALAALLISACLFARVGSPEPTRVGNSIRQTFSKGDGYWMNAKETNYRTVPELLKQHRARLERGMTHSILIHAPLLNRKIALTFDDGPHPQYTRELLAVLRKQNVKATFFLVGEMAERYPQLVRAELADGHSVGNHTYHHVNLTRISPGYVATEIAACDEVLESITGKPAHIFRPPGGDYDDNVVEVCEALGHTMVLWTDDPGDYARPGPEVIRRRILDRARSGGIILIHDGVQQTIDVLPDVIQKLKKRGYEFITIDEMLQEDRKL